MHSSSGPATPAQLQEVEKLVSEIYGNNLQKGSDAIIELAKYYKGKYADWAEYALYLKMVGGPSGVETKVDFPGDDSVPLKLREILAKLSSSSEP